MRRPAVPSRTRLDSRDWCCHGVGEELAIEGVGDPTFQAPHRFEGLLALGALAPVVGPSVGVKPQLGDRGDVDDVVDPAVPGPGEPVPVVLPGGHVQGCGAGPRGEPVAVGEPGDVADVGGSVAVPLVCVIESYSLLHHDEHELVRTLRRNPVVQTVIPTIDLDHGDDCPVIGAMARTAGRLGAGHAAYTALVSTAGVVTYRADQIWSVLGEEWPVLEVST